MPVVSLQMSIQLFEYIKSLISNKVGMEPLYGFERNLGQMDP